MTRNPAGGARGAVGTDRWIGRDTGRDTVCQPHGTRRQPARDRTRAHRHRPREPARRATRDREAGGFHAPGRPADGEPAGAAADGRKGHGSADGREGRTAAATPPQERLGELGEGTERDPVGGPLRRRESEPWAATGPRAGVAASRVVRTQPPSRVEVRSFEAVRSFEPRASNRAFAVERAGATRFESAPMRVAAPRSAPRGNFGPARR